MGLTFPQRYTVRPCFPSWVRSFIQKAYRNPFSILHPDERKELVDHLNEFGVICHIRHPFSRSRVDSVRLAANCFNAGYPHTVGNRTTSWYPTPIFSIVDAFPFTAEFEFFP